MNCEYDLIGGLKITKVFGRAQYCYVTALQIYSFQVELNNRLVCPRLNRLLFTSCV